MSTNELSFLLQSFFIVRLTQEKKVSRYTLASYSKTFEFLFRYAKKRLNKPPEKITLKDINARFVSEFLDYLEDERNISHRTRNCRLAAIRSFFQYLNPKIPEMSQHIAEILAIPNKRTYQKQIDFLDEEEVKALLNAPDQHQKIGRRDYVMLTIAIESGLRLSELIHLEWGNIQFGEITTIDCLGKGRKFRSTPVSSQVEKCLKEWANENRCLPHDVVFPNARGKMMSPDAVQYLVKKYARKAGGLCSSLRAKKVSPHVLRHTAAMRLLASGAELADIALWLGHESIKTAYIYLSADVQTKEKILKKLHPPEMKLFRYKPNKQLMNFLKNQQKMKEK